MEHDSKGQYEITVIYDGKLDSPLLINGDNGFKDPWMDLGLLLEGVGLLISTCINDGKTEHNGQPIDEYIKGYIVKATADYQRTTGPHRTTN